VAHEPIERLSRPRDIVRMQTKPRIDERSDEPWPYRALVVCAKVFLRKKLRGRLYRLPRRLVRREDRIPVFFTPSGVAHRLLLTP
jgi:hypothetical protein